MKILLVEPAYNSKYAPLGLLKISAMHKARGDDVLFIKGRKRAEFNPDTIYITSLFTFWYKITIETILFYKKEYPNSEIKVGGIFASLMPEFIEKYTGIKPFFGLIEEAEKYYPDYSFYDADSSIVFTSRGCLRKCKFCVVPKIEGNLYSLDDWENQVDITKPYITFWDNNWFAKGYDKVKEDVGKIKVLMKAGIKSFDFNQGLDARLFNREIAELLCGLPLRPIRFAFDNISEDGPVQDAIKLAREFGFTRDVEWSGGSGSQCTIYVLYNFKDTPKDFYYRIREILRCGGTSFPMQYSPHDDLKRTYIGKNWTKIQRDGVKKYNG